MPGKGWIPEFPAQPPGCAEAICGGISVTGNTPFAGKAPRKIAIRKISEINGEEQQKPCYFQPRLCTLLTG
jgi:hypothetical protein